MAVYNTSWMVNATSLPSMFSGIGKSMGSEFLYGHLILMTFFLMFLTLTLRIDFDKVLIYDSFLTTVLAVLLFYAGLIPMAAISYPDVLFMIAMVVFNFT